jgi:hypothetical protein
MTQAFGIAFTAAGVVTDVDGNVVDNNEEKDDN